MFDLSALTPVDIGALAVIAFGTIQGFFRKLSGELPDLISVVVSLVAGIMICTPLAEWLNQTSRLDIIAARALAFIAVLVAATIAMLIIRFILSRIMKVIFEPTADRIGGMLAGAIRGATLVLIVFMSMNLVDHEYLNRKFGEESVIGQTVRRVAPLVKDMVRDAAEESNALRSATEKGTKDDRHSGT